MSSTKIGLLHQEDTAVVDVIKSLGVEPDELWVVEMTQKYKIT